MINGIRVATQTDVTHHLYLFDFLFEVLVLRLVLDVLDTRCNAGDGLVSVLLNEARIICDAGGMVHGEGIWLMHVGNGGAGGGLARHGGGKGRRCAATRLA